MTNVLEQKRAQDETNEQRLAALNGLRWMTVAQAAEYTTLGVRMIRRLVAERRIPFTKVGAHLRFAKVDLDELMAAGRREAVRR